MKRFLENVGLGLCVFIIAPLGVAMAVALGVAVLALYAVVIIGEGMSTIIQERLCEKNGRGPSES